ncbi:MAG: FtsL-like putative cell division protein [Bacteroidota bacterium]
MSKEKENNKTKNTREFKISSVKGLIDGSVLTSKRVVNQLPFLLFLTILAIIYIANRYNAEKKIMQTIKLDNEIKELKSEQLAIASELMYISKQSEVSKMIQKSGIELFEAKDVPKIIKIND